MTTTGQHLYIVRHGMRQDFEDATWAARAERPHDPPLSPVGLRQAHDTGTALRGRGIVTIHVSPFLRTLQTAAALADAVAAPMLCEPGFSEWLNPAWMQAAPRLLSPPEAVRLFPRLKAETAMRPLPRFPEQAEDPDVRARVQQALERVLQQEPARTLAIVTHGSPLGQLCGLLLGDLAGIDFGMASITHIVREGGRARLVESSRRHLRDQDEPHRFN